MPKNQQLRVASLVTRPFRPQRYPSLLPIVTHNKSTASLADRVLDVILRQIVTGELVSGTKLTSTDVAESLQVSRTPVAKAIATLAADGLLVQRNNHQAVVSPGAEHWLLDIHTLRQLIEPEAAAQAAGRLPTPVIEDLCQLRDDASAPQMEATSEAAFYFDWALHLAIADSCNNLPLRVKIRKCWNYRRLVFGNSVYSSDEIQIQYSHHCAILDAVVEGKADLARKLMQTHLSHPACSPRLASSQVTKKKSRAERPAAKKQS